MHKIVLLSICLCCCLFSCNEKQTKEEEPYLRWVGDIPFDPKTDDPEFELCYEEKYVRQYFNFSKGVQYQGEKPAIIQHFKDHYKAVESDQSGLLRIRFIVNCKGETGRFRLMSANENLEPMEFDTEISDQLLQLTQQMDGWLPIAEETMDDMELDYYQYLIFKIHNGEIIEIMP